MPQWSFQDPEFDAELQRKASERTPRTYPWPDTDEETVAVYAGLATFFTIGLFCTIAGIEIDTIGFAAIGTAFCVAGIAYFWRKRDLNEWQARVDKEYWRQKSEKNMKRLHSLGSRKD